MSFHPYHMVEQSPWPLFSSMSGFILTCGLLDLFHNKSLLLLYISLVSLTLSGYLWWRDIAREATFQGRHTSQVYTGLKWGMMLFIASEVLFFFSFFWGYFHMMLTPDLELGGCWPPGSITPFNPYEVPFLNTIVLLSSGVSVTWAHHALIAKNSEECINSLMLTIFLGFYFSFLQYFEYTSAPFSINDSVFSSLFFVATGFHGLHVIIGSIFLFVNFIRFNLSHLNSTHHFSFEAAAWYWHFVDIVWLFLYTFVYWWPF